MATKNSEPQPASEKAKDSIGPRLRKLRQDSGLSIAELAAKVEVTSGLISQVENGKADPSFVTLRKIAKILNVPLFYLFLDESRNTKVRSSSDRLVLSTQGGNVKYEFISDPNDGQVEFTTVFAKPGHGSGKGMDSHPGCECAMVLKGKMKLEIEGTILELGPNDSITFDALRLHRWESVGKEDLHFISVASVPFLR